MADSLPLLSQSDSNNHDTNVDVTSCSLDDMIEQSIGGFGWSQLAQAFLVALASIFDSQQSFINVYTDSVPTWHCTNTTTCNNTTSNICELSKSDWTWDSAVSSESSIISEWGLECSSAFIRSLPASSHFMGCLLGILFVSTLADSSLGRKNLLLLSCLVMSFTTFTIVLSRNIWIYSLLRFISGVARASIGTCTIVLLTERIGRRWRGLSGVIDAAFFVIGTLSLPAITYINGGSGSSSWRTMYLWTSIPGAVYCVLLYFFVSESPRWLFMQGRVEEAIATLKRLSPSSKEDIKFISLNDLVVQSSTTNKHQESACKFIFFSSIADLFIKNWVRQRTVALMVLGFGIGTVYYGMTFGNGNLGVVFNGMSELPSVLVIFYLIKSLNRRSSVLTLCVTSGICCILTVIVRSELEIIQFGLEVGSFFGACTAFNVILIYAIELFPTCVRNSATSMARQALNFGAIFSSILVSVGDKNEFLSNVVFGLIIICCGFSVVFLPETKGAALCDTFNEQESKDNVVV